MNSSCSTPPSPTSSSFWPRGYFHLKPQFRKSEPKLRKLMFKFSTIFNKQKLIEFFTILSNMWAPNSKPPTLNWKMPPNSRKNPKKSKSPNKSKSRPIRNLETSIQNWKFSTIMLMPTSAMLNKSCCPREYPSSSWRRSQTE